MTPRRLPRCRNSPASVAGPRSTCCCAACGRFNIFPGDDVGGRNGLRDFLGIEDDLDYDGVRQTLARWHAWGGFIYFHLLVNALADKGIVRA